MNYWFWENNKETDDAFIYGGWPHDCYADSLLTGDIAEMPPKPIKITMDSESQGRLTDNLLLTGPVKVFSDRLVGILNQNAIVNLQYFPCIIHNLLTDENIYTYKIINIIGKIKCVDFSNSSVASIPGNEQQFFAWDYLTLNEENIKNAKMFVLSEMPSQVVVHDSIRTVLKNNNITGINFVPQGDYGYVF